MSLFLWGDVIDASWLDRWSSNCIWQALSFLDLAPIFISTPHSWWTRDGYVLGHSSSFNLSFPFFFNFIRSFRTDPSDHLRFLKSVWPRPLLPPRCFLLFLLLLPLSSLCRDEFDAIETKLLAAVQLGAGEIDPDLQIAMGILFNVSADFSKAVDCFETALKVYGSAQLKKHITQSIKVPKITVVIRKRMAGTTVEQHWSGAWHENGD